jgi:uncharacterized protein YcbX
MHVAQLWRYPVKSMAGEQLTSALLTTQGIAGDRIVHVENRQHQPITSRTHPRLLGLHARLNAAGKVEVDGREWTHPKVQQDIEDIVGAGASLTGESGLYRFDILPLLVATDGAIAAFGHDSRRLRPNLVIGGVEGLEERNWPGKCLQIGDVRIGVEDLRGRCVMTTYDPDTQQQDPNVLREIVRKFAGKLALNCFVIQGGEIRVGDVVRLIAMPKGAEKFSTPWLAAPQA